MLKDELDDLGVRGFSISSSGSISERVLQREFWGPGGASLEAAGFAGVEELDSLHLPSGVWAEDRDREITAVIGVDDALIGISLFIVANAGSWAIGRICDGVWDGKLRKPFERMLKRLRSEGYADRPMTVCFGVWYDLDRVYIGAFVELSDGDDAQLAELIPLAQHRGLEWIEANGITKPVVVFPVKEGKLAETPLLMDQIPG